MISAGTVGVPVWVGVNVAVSVAVDVSEGIGVIVEIAMTLFPILQLARTKKDHKRSKNFFFTMINSVIIYLLSLYFAIQRPTNYYIAVLA
jgi:L-lactate permease